MMVIYTQQYEYWVTKQKLQTECQLGCFALEVVLYQKHVLSPQVYAAILGLFENIFSKAI